jgi:ABC-type phosphate/phosphonate transport system substrate-binding protein
MFAKLYMEREVKEEWNKYFKLSEAKNADDAIEEAVEGKAAAVLVTSTQAEVYKSRKPGRYNRLRVLTESIDFPTAVVVYRPTPGREKELAQFKDALLKSDQTAEGRQTLTLWRLDGFRELTKEFEATADFAGKKYPEK